MTGSFAALGIAIALGVLGLAIAETAGLTSSGATAWLAVWSLIVPIIATFAGGFVGGRSGLAVSRLHLAATGVGIWGFSYVIGAALLSFASVAFRVMPRGGLASLTRAGAGGDQVTIYTWFFFASIVLALVGSVIGATLGAGQEVRVLTERPLTVQKEVRA